MLSRVACAWQSDALEAATRCSAMGWGGGRHGGGRRAGAQWIGEPPRCCTRVGIAVFPCADGCLRIWASVTARWRAVGDSAGEGRFCCGGAPARREWVRSQPRRSCCDRDQASWVQSLAVISAQQKPASSRATAVATTDLTFLRAARAAKRLERRFWAFQERAMVAGLAPSWRWRMVGPRPGVVLVGPGRFAQLAADVAVAGSGDRASPLGQAGGVLRAGQAGEAHERCGRWGSVASRRPRRPGTGRPCG